jgi:Fur family transcriptional regulator, ferric uptake regulator
MSLEVQEFKKLLKSSGYIVTKERRELFDTLQRHNTLTIKELIALSPSVHHVTVYRNIKIFEELGIITYLRLGWNSKLELSDIFRHHHHHLTCLKCGKVTVLKDNPVLEAEISRLSARRSFKPTDHQLEIRGYCSNCR